MTDSQAPARRPDLDILTDVEDSLFDYGPLNNDRHHLNITVVDGVVWVSGYVKTMNTHSYLVRSLKLVDGVRDVRTDELRVDDLMRLEIGRYVPVGTSVYAEYGTVVLSGTLPHGVEPDDIAARVGAVPGVRRVVTAFYR